MRYLCLLLFGTLPFLATGQEAVWKKEVSRLIEIRSKHNPNAKDSALGAVIFSAIASHQINTYTNHLKDSVSAKTKDELKWYHHESNSWDSVYQFRVFEEWTFDKKNTITIKINYIAPVKNIYNEDGSLRGRQAVFVSSLLKKNSLIFRSQQRNPKIICS